jgi:hypothetical protein
MAIRNFNRLLFSDKRLDAATIPFPDSRYKYPYGFSIAFKKRE